ncbi:MFS transporter [Rhizobium sp. Root1204]|uniref:MFS transporter n=1 Tax=Rhizobium sp. Root1204 TaxID=1736428 RepID=UPI00071308BF|nr:MFS transporter [Rhizobium sp. Root1204]KQV41214.1 MFS transporter [Rhizobium sp. Root1204]
MDKRKGIPHGVLFLIAGTGIVTLARAMTFSFLAIKLQQTFGLGPAMIGFLLGLGPLIGALAGPFVGSLSDKTGRKAMLTLVLITLSLATVALGLAETILVFCLAQCVAAVAISIYGPISRALMSDLCAEPVRLKYFSWRYTASNIGWAIGPLLGIAAGIVSTPLFLAAAAVYATLAFVLQLLNLPSSICTGSYPPKPVQLIAGIRAAVCDRRLLHFIGGGTLLIAVHGQWTATLAPYLADNLAGGVEIFAYLVSINGVVVLSGNPFARRFIERRGALSALVTGCILLLVSQVGFLVSTGLAGFAISMVIFTAGEILIVPSEYMLVDGISSAQNRGSYFGAHSISTIGSFVGPTLGGATLGILGGPAMFLLFAGFAAAGALFFAAGTRMPPPYTRTGTRVARECEIFNSPAPRLGWSPSGSPTPVTTKIFNNLVLSLA